MFWVVFLGGMKSYNNVVRNMGLDLFSVLIQSRAAYGKILSCDSLIFLKRLCYCVEPYFISGELVHGLGVQHVQSHRYLLNFSLHQTQS